MNKTVKDLPSSGIRKFFDLVLQSDDIISLGVGEPDFITPWHIREGAIYALEKGHTTYTSNKGMIELRQSISNKLRNDFKVDYDPENQILITVGVSEGLDLTLRTILNPKDEVIIPKPCFVSYDPLVKLAQGIPISVKTKEEHDFELQPDIINESITKNTKAIILNSPNNPTGAVLSKNTIKQICEIALNNKLTIISDEIYSELVYDKPFNSFASIPEIKDNLILLNGFSKAYAMTGLRIGYVAANQDIIRNMNKIHQYSIMCAPTTGQMAAIEALRNGKKEQDKMKRSYHRRRRYIVSKFNSMGLPCSMPKGAFYVFPNITNTKLSSETFCTELLKDYKVAVVPGTAFGKIGEGYIRCSYAASLEEIKIAMERIEKFCSN